VSAGAAVYIVWLTSGDAFATDAMLVEHTLEPGPEGLQRLALRRMAEAREAASLLGVSSTRQIFLGYPDRGLLELLVDNYLTPMRSKHTGAVQVPYTDALSPQAAYTGYNLERDLGRVLATVRPTLVLAPSPLDRHPDHRAAGSLTVRALSALGQLDRGRYWIVHAGSEWPQPHGLHAELPLTPPLSGRGLQWQELELTLKERNLKQASIRAHHTQMEIMGSFLLAYVRSSELFATAPVPEPSANSRSDIPLSSTPPGSAMHPAATARNP
jgi:LmbE family N-acetylglucosaminyl deacetylase